MTWEFDPPRTHQLMRKSKIKLHTTSCGASRYVGSVFFSTEQELASWLQEVYMAEGTYIDRTRGLALAWWLE